MLCFLRRRVRLFFLYIQYMQLQENELELRHMPYLCLFRKRQSAKKKRTLMRGVFERGRRLYSFSAFLQKEREREMGSAKTKTG
jgi:hypothetical protein